MKKYQGLALLCGNNVPVLFNGRNYWPVATADIATHALINDILSADGDSTITIHFQWRFLGTS